MAVCGFCSKETDRYMICVLIDNGDICFACCFSTSSGSPIYLNRIKKQFGISKERVLDTCSNCMARNIKR